MSERKEYTPDDEDVEETYVAYEERFSAEADPRGNYRRWLATHDRDLREQIARLQATVHVLTSERDAALVRNNDLIVTHSAECEQAWCEGYYTGKRDYAGSVMGGTPISTPNPYTSRIARGEGSE